ncbi:MAG: histidine kinase [Lachnospiraceae bacterium]|nr:histidine kinase [Lachnospiraceae bacterium]
MRYRNGGRRSLYFLGILLFDIAMLLSNAAAWQIISVYDLRPGAFLTHISNTFFGFSDFSYFIILGLLIKYLTEYISEKTDVPVILSNICMLYCMICAILWFISAYTGIIVSTGEAGVIPGPLYYFGQSGGYIVALLTVYLLIRYHGVLSRIDMIVILSFVLMPIIGVIIRPLFPDIVLLPFMITYSIVSLHCFIHINRALLLEKQHTELEKTRAEIMLDQIRPHFIYNTLNSIYALCDISMETAKETIADFADYLRNNLKHLRGDELIFFDQEISLVRNYLKIEKLRFDDALEIVYDIEASDFMLPPLALQTIVENAVSHGIEKKEGGGTLTISTRLTGSGYTVTVRDTGPGYDSTTTGSHIGLDNTAYRLKHLCNADLNINYEEGTGTTVMFSIPAKDKSYENTRSRQ